MEIRTRSDLEKYANIRVDLFLILAKEDLDPKQASSFLDANSFIIENFIVDLSKDNSLAFSSNAIIKNLDDANGFFASRDLKAQLRLLANYLDRTLNGIDYYQIYSEDTLRKVFSEYPNIAFQSIQISFSINTRLYAGIVYELIDTLPKTSYSIHDSKVDIVFFNENEFRDSLKTFIDLYYMTRKWSSFKILFNDIEISKDVFYYLYAFLGYDKKVPLVDRTDEYKKKKSIHIQKKQKQLPHPLENRIILSGLSFDKILDIVVDEFRKEYLDKFSYHIIVGDHNDRIIIIEDQVIFYFVLDNKRLRSRLSNYPCLTIQELTYNEMIKLNFSSFCKKFQLNKLIIDYLKFKNLGGKHFFNEDYEYFDFANLEYPQLNLRQRYEQNPGILYHFLITSITDEHNLEHYGIGYTTNSVYKLFLKICKELLNSNYNSINCNGVNGLLYRESKDFLQTFLSQKGTPKIKRLEENISYFVIDKYIKTDSDLTNTYSTLLQEIQSTTKYTHLERGYYKKPQNRWKTEEMVYNIIHNLYGNYQVIYQYRPFFLKTPKGQLSYDIYICGLKIAIEYQGQQHFYPVEYFGGKDHFESQQKRDELKKQLSIANGITLIYINYYDDITPELIKSKIKEALSARK